jgi:hypothetical protein
MDGGLFGSGCRDWGVLARGGDWLNSIRRVVQYKGLLEYNALEVVKKLIVITGGVPYVSAQLRPCFGARGRFLFALKMHKPTTN